MQTLDIHNIQHSEFSSFRVFGDVHEINSTRTTALLEQLQTTLELDKLLNIFAMEVSNYLDFAGLVFKHGDTSATMRGTRKAKLVKQFELKINGELVGTLSYHTNKRIDDQTLSILNKLHRHFIYPLKNATLYHTAMSLAMQDSLTRLGNRRHFDEQLHKAMHQARRKHRQLGLIVGDLDRFKAINDTFGHSVGDEVLQEFAKALSASVRDSDSVFRMGGDEFAMIIEDACDQSLRIIESRLLSAVKRSPVLQKYQVSCSLGSSFFNRTDNDKTFFDRADQDLYRQKMNMAHKKLTLV